MKQLLVIVATTVLLSASVLAEELKLDVSSPDAIKKALETLAGKPVTLHLSDGAALSGIVEASGPEAVRLGQLTGKEFYSAIIEVETITAVVYRSK